MARHEPPAFAGPQRDFVGYSDAPPDFAWPDGSRLAVNIVINYEEGSERSAFRGDTQRERLLEMQYDVADDERELVAESAFEYGSRVGIWRILALLTELEVPATIFACPDALLQNPRVVPRLLAHGCDFVGHGSRWIQHYGLSVDHQRADVQCCIADLERLTGKKILGWFTRPPNTVATRELLATEGLLYDSGAINDDLPYFDTVAGKPFLVVPYSLDVNDTRFYKGQFFTGADFEVYARDAFDVLHRESRSHGRMMSIGLHPRIIGRPGRFGGLRRFLEHIVQRNDVWIARRNDIAEFWASTFGSDETWNLPRRYSRVTYRRRPQH